jgi:hypothetical protein
MSVNLHDLLQHAHRSLGKAKDIYLLGTSGLFDVSWYRANNPDIAKTKLGALLHYLEHGGFEGRDPGPGFASAWYLDTYDDVKKAGINPLVHYLKYGRGEGRGARLQPRGMANSQYKCPVCEKSVSEFLPISSYYEENRKKYGHPFTFEDSETMNSKHYQCPHCGAADRDRLYVLYLRRVLKEAPSEKTIRLLDIAPSNPLKSFLVKQPNIKYLSADKYMEDVDIVIDITDMHTIQEQAFDIFICSHVLEHVIDDRMALIELFRILKPGGIGILMVPINLELTQIDEDPNIHDIGERWRRFGQHDHVRLYSKRGFMERVEEAGFLVNQYGIDFFGAEEFFCCGISKKSVLYIVGKKGPPMFG